MFLNPFAMVVGGALISAPILIHLINRMRYKRIRWAAMEFLLKSQKRNRRRLIIEQLILLMLRCLLIMLAGLLVARFIAEVAGATASSSTTHVVLLDDTLSLRDRAPKNEPGVAAEAFSQARDRIHALATHASQAGSAQQLKLITMSDRKVIFNDRLNDDSVGALKKVLDNLTATAVHVDPTDAVDFAQKELGESRDSKRWLHIVSDFRDSDWGRKPHTEKLHAILNEVAEAGSRVTLIDAAAPLRSAGKGVDNHNNMAITELKPDKRIAPAGTVVPFTVEVENFGNETRDGLFLEVFVNGIEDFNAARVFAPAPSPGSKQRYTFDIIFDGPAEGQKARFHRITCRIKDVDNESGLKEDNARHAVVEVRREVPTLVIDGNPDVGKRSGGDTRVISDALESINGSTEGEQKVKSNEAVKVVLADKGIEELLRPDLEREFATIYLLNVENFRSRDKEKENAPLQALRRYVQNGGNVVFFTGDRIDANYYNETLYKENKGLFPVPIVEQGTRRISDKEIEQRRESRAPKIFVLERDHPITRGLYDMQYNIPDLIIPQHTPAQERFLWSREDWYQEGDIKELITLAELKPLDDTARAQVQRFLKLLPLDDPNYQKYQERLTFHKKAIENALLGKSDQMYLVAEAIDNMLNDRGAKPGDKDNVSLAEFWALADMKDVKRSFLEFRKAALYGKPLVLTRKYGKGSVVAVMTSAGTKWSGWSGGADGGVASFTFPMFIADLQKYLTRGGDSGSRLVGEPIRFELDPQQYRNEIRRMVQADEGMADKGREAKEAPPGFTAEDPKFGKAIKDGEGKDKLQFTFENSTRPGVHFFQLYPAGGKPGEVEERWFAFNVDTASESNLRRAASEDVARNPTDAPPSRPAIKWFVPEESVAVLREKKSDLSESWPLYLIFLLVLIVEQALAVHLSFHTRGNEPAAGTTAAPTKAEAAAAASV